eukprot:CAMPEP_0180214516 /NCGR_PEP_ID=MMETSP0987-20121128/14956_1 /TAXON_ID=697907 /ORGANISM="non described non described, Strain CCMP2293" /LENGTH=107 /DNA_ID=CAMNT_0022173017 /DNA_START=463 /DNA_END=782 /DNA_ORIENTATION=+
MSSYSFFNLFAERLAPVGGPDAIFPAPVSNSTDDRLTATAAARLEPDPAAGTPETRPPSSPPPNTRALFLLAQAYPLAPPPPIACSEVWLPMAAGVLFAQGAPQGAN